MSKFSKITLVLPCLLLAACLPFGDSDQDELKDDAPSPTVIDNRIEENTAPRETPNVTYKGVVQPAGISIYQQGSHRLVLEDDRFILLESDQIDLNGYVGESVEVFGSISPTVEEGGIIMTVENINLDQVDEEDVEDDEVDTVTDTETGAVIDDEDEEDLTEEEELDEDEVDTVTDTDTGAVIDDDEDEEEDVADDEPEETIPLSGDRLESVVAMSHDSYVAERWTQEYCTSHLGFCIPIHKNWWYKSFGNTTTNLWHVEMLNAPIDNIGDGVILVKLVSGTVGSEKATDGQIRVQDDQVIGYRSWEGNMHFEVVANSALTEPVTYITQQISEFQE